VTLVATGGDIPIALEARTVIEGEDEDEGEG
jgi:hypothetical protein